MFHLGDHERDAQYVRTQFPGLPLCSVSGNCDDRPQNPDSAVFNITGVRIFATHGHRYRVKFTLDALCNAGYFSGANLILFGHTHAAMHRELDGMHLFNPGSAGLGAHRTWGLITLEHGQIQACEILPVPPHEKTK